MGNWLSETMEKAEVEESAPTPAVLSLHQRYSIDPRSPSNFINRTPILLCNKPNISIDPRSPSTEINRTPLFCSLHRANEMTPMAQMQRTSTAAVDDDDVAAIIESTPAAEAAATTAASLTDQIKPLCLDGAFNNEEDEEDDDDDEEEEEVEEEKCGVSRHLSEGKVVDDISADRLTTEKEEEVEEKDVEEEEENLEEPQCHIAAADSDSDPDPDPEDIPTISDISELLDLTTATDVDQPGRLAMLDISDYPAVGVGSEAGAGEDVDRHDEPAILSFSDRVVVEPVEGELQSRPVILELTDDLTTPGAVFKEDEEEEEKMMKPNEENLAKTSYIDGSAADSDDASIGDYSNSSSSDGSYSCSEDCSNGSSLCGSIDSSSVGGGSSSSSSDGVVVVDDVISEILLKASMPDDDGCSAAADDDDDTSSTTTTTTTTAATTTSSNTTTTTVTTDPILGSPEDQQGVKDKEKRNKMSGIPLAVKKSSSVSDLGTSTLTSDGEKKPTSLLRLLPKQQSLLQRPASTTAIISSSSNKGGNLRYKNRRGVGSGCVAGSRSPLQSRNCMVGGRVAGHSKRSGLAKVPPSKGRMATSSTPWAMGAVEPTRAVDKENLSVRLH